MPLVSLEILAPDCRGHRWLGSISNQEHPSLSSCSVGLRWLAVTVDKGSQVRGPGWYWAAEMRLRTPQLLSLGSIYRHGSNNNLWHTESISIIIVGFCCLACRYSHVSLNCKLNTLKRCEAVSLSNKLQNTLMAWGCLIQYSSLTLIHSSQCERGNERTLPPKHAVTGHLYPSRTLSHAPRFHKWPDYTLELRSA